MRTSKPIATVSYNTENFLEEQLGVLIKNHKISDYMYIRHHAEEDEKKDHWHVWIKPNTLLDTMDLQKFFMELDPKKPTKPLKCIDFSSSKVDDWILYNQHYEPYLASKGESRKYHYFRSDFKYYDEDTFEDRYNHAFKGSEWAKSNQILEALHRGQLNPTRLILNGTIPLNMASQLNAFKYMQTHYGTDRGQHSDHEEKTMVFKGFGELVWIDPKVARVTHDWKFFCECPGADDKIYEILVSNDMREHRYTERNKV